MLSLKDLNRIRENASDRAKDLYNDLEEFNDLREQLKGLAEYISDRAYDLRADIEDLERAGIDFQESIKQNAKGFYWDACREMLQRPENERDILLEAVFDFMTTDQLELFTYHIAEETHSEHIRALMDAERDRLEYQTEDLLEYLDFEALTGFDLEELILDAEQAEHDSL